MIPDTLPILSPGKQPPGSGKVCAEQAVNWLVSGRLDLGDETDHPECVQPVLNALAIRVNDSLPADRRGEMWPLILRQPGTAHPEMEPVLSIRLAAFCTEQVLDLTNDRSVPLEAIAAVRAWCDDPSDANSERCRSVRAAYAAAHAAAFADAIADAAAAVAASAAYAPAAYDAAHALALGSAFADAIADATAAYDADRLLALLSAVQDECERLTGHVPSPPDVDRLLRLGELVGVRRPPDDDGLGDMDVFQMAQISQETQTDWD